MSTLRITVEWLDAATTAASGRPRRIGSTRRCSQAVPAARAATPPSKPPCATSRPCPRPPSPPRRSMRAPRRPRPFPTTTPTQPSPCMRGASWRSPARKRRSPRTRRTRRARHVEGAVTYDWRATPETAAHRDALARIARSVTALGCGIDLATAQLSLHAQPPRRCAGDTLHPRPRRAAPSPCALARGVRCARGRVPGQPHPHRRRHRGRPERAAGAHRRLRLRARAAACAHAPRSRFAPPTTGPLGVEGTRAVEVAAMVRHAVGRAARCGGARPGCHLRAHGPRRRAPHPRRAPAHRGAPTRRRMHPARDAHRPDGRARRCVGRRGGAACRRAARSRTRARPAGVLAPLDRGDAVLRRFRAESRRWTTATPVVMPGCDHRRGRPRPHRALRRLLRHAGIAEALRRIRNARARAAPRGQRFCAPVPAPAPPRPLPRRAPLGDVAHRRRRPPRARRRHRLRPRTARAGARLSAQEARGRSIETHLPGARRGDVQAWKSS